MMINTLYVHGYAEKEEDTIYLLLWTSIYDTPFSSLPEGRTGFTIAMYKGVTASVLGTLLIQFPSIFLFFTLVTFSYNHWALNDCKKFV